MILTFVIAGVILGMYMLLIEPFRIKIIEREVITRKWAGNKEIKIALIADVHAIWPWMSAVRIRGIINKTNELNPDLILMLGDYVNTNPIGVKPKAIASLALYEKLSAPCGVFSVIGNHDLYTNGEWANALRNISVPLLENKAVKVERSGVSMWIAGLEEYSLQKADVQKTLNQVTDDAPVIMMTHNPDAFIDVPQSVALTVAGHTHAGQIRFPFIGAIEAIIPSKYGKRFLYGHIQEQGKDLIVSAGLGTTGLPLRLLTPPEIVVVTLKSDR